MTNLTVVNKDGILYVDSREVADMVGKRPSDLIRDIEGYIQILENAKLRSLEFFVKSSYQVEGQKRHYTCYLLTKKGCDMVANKMIGEKGVLFTAAYIEKFYEMEAALTQPKNNALEEYQAMDEDERAIAYFESRRENKRLALVAAEQAEQLADAAPKVEVYEVLCAAKEDMTLTQAAKKMNMGFGVKEMNRKLHEYKILMKQNRNANDPRSQYVKAGWFTLKPIPKKDFYGIPYTIDQTMVTPYGLTQLINLFKRKGY